MCFSKLKKWEPLVFNDVSNMTLKSEIGHEGGNKLI